MTYTPRSEFLHVLTERGFVQDCTDTEGLDDRLRAGPVPAYIGYDCTGPSLHVGHLVNIMMLRWLQKCGHTPIVLMGGGTTRIGDPSGKDETRQLLTDAKIAENMASLRGVFSTYLQFEEHGGNAIQPNNAEWLNRLTYIDFLRDYGRHFTINRMLTFESVKGRLDREQPLTFLEFNYMLLQAYDFLELYRREGCALQMGGSDQWGNIVNGIDLTRRIEGAEVYGLTTPLLTTSDGRKMGKSAAGAVWLNRDMLSAYDFWQFWRNTTDADVGRFLKLFTELPVDECERLGALSGAEINEAKTVLATEVTALAHGRHAAEAAAETARETFAAGGMGADLPVIEVAPADLPISVAQLFVRAGLASSGKDAKRLIEGGGARIGDRALDNPGEMIAADTLAEPVRLSAGKKRHAMARVSG
ncbi:MAG: tyrosine--tRNA ligase [Pseudomonadota bacterium]